MKQVRAPAHACVRARVCLMCALCVPRASCVCVCARARACDLSRVRTRTMRVCASVYERGRLPSSRVAETRSNAAATCAALSPPGRPASQSNERADERMDGRNRKRPAGVLSSGQMWPPRFWADVRYCWAFNATECAACGPPSAPACPRPSTDRSAVDYCHACSR